MSSPASTVKAPSVREKRKGKFEEEKCEKKLKRDTINDDLEAEVEGKKKLTLPLTKSNRGLNMLKMSNEANKLRQNSKYKFERARKFVLGGFTSKESTSRKSSVSQQISTENTSKSQASNSERGGSTVSVRKVTTTTNVSLVYSTLQNENITHEEDITEDRQAPCVSVSDMFADQSNECLNEDLTTVTNII